MNDVQLNNNIPVGADPTVRLPMILNHVGLIKIPDNHNEKIKSRQLVPRIPQTLVPTIGKSTHTK
jgi:hypothetical protein